MGYLGWWARSPFYLAIESLQRLGAREQPTVDGMSNLVALLQFQFFAHRDLRAWLNEPFTGLPVVAQAKQLVLAEIA